MITSLIQRFFRRLFKIKDENCIRRIKYLLLNDGQAIGKAYSSTHPDIRIVSAKNFSDAYRFFIKLCDQRLLRYRQVRGHLFYKIELPDNIGNLELSDKINKKNDRIVAVIRTDITEITPHVKEIRFMKPKTDVSV